MPSKTETTWMKLVKQTKKENPTKQFKEILKLASQKYKK
jgi:hypothetical protein